MPVAWRRSGATCSSKKSDAAMRDPCHGPVFEAADGALRMELYPWASRRADAFDNMRAIDYRIDEVNNRIHVGEKAG